MHHSDRGVQYASGDYTDLLNANGIQISMSRHGNPYDNARCKSFMKTLKHEEVYRNEYRDLAEARAQIGAFVEKVYNLKRLHSALGYLPLRPSARRATDGEEFGGGCAAASRVSFLRHRRSIHPMWKEQTGSRRGARSRLSSARMSRSRLFLSRSVSAGARFHLCGFRQNAVLWTCRSSDLQRTANSVLFGCLSRGVHPKAQPRSHWAYSMKHEA